MGLRVDTGHAVDIGGMKDNYDWIPDTFGFATSVLLGINQCRLPISSVSPSRGEMEDKNGGLHPPYKG